MHRPEVSREDAHYPREAVEALTRDMLAIYERCGREVTYRPREDSTAEKKYWPRRYYQRLKSCIRTGHVFDFAELLANASQPSRGFSILKDAGRLDLTLEALITDDSKPYHLYFTDEAFEKARGRLTEHAGRPSVPPVPPPSGERSGMVQLKPGDTLYLRVEVGPGGELKVTAV